MNEDIVGPRGAERQEALRRRRRGRVLGLLLIAAAFTVLVVATNRGEGTQRDPAAPTPPEAAACGAEPPPEASPKRYDRPPEMTLERGVDYGAEIHTSCGTLVVDLLEDSARVAVNNFVFLARDGFYEGLQWNRVEGNSVIQTGDPNNQSAVQPEGPGYTIPDDPPRKPKEYVYGVVAMANAGPDTGGSQFFIVVHENRPAGFQAAYTIFGTVERASYDVLNEIAKQRVRGGSDPIESVEPIVPIYIESIEITES